MPREKAGGNMSLNRFVSMWGRIIVPCNPKQRWRDQFFDGALRVFVKKEQDSRVGKLERENVRLKALVAGFALDVKKNGDL